MGTLFNQQPRKYQHKNDINTIIDEIKKIKSIRDETGLTYDQVIETCNMLELRRKNDLYVANGDIFDEQMSGIGSLLDLFLEAFMLANVEENQIAKAIEKIAQSISNGFGSGSMGPAFLEAIAIQMGYGQGIPYTIIDAISNLKSE